MNPFPYLKEEAQLNLLPTEKPTELNRFAQDLPQRTLDHALISQGLEGRVTSFTPADPELALVQEAKPTKRDQTENHFDPMQLFSDHAPQFRRVEGPNPREEPRVEPKMSLFAGLKAKILGYKRP